MELLGRQGQKKGIRNQREVLLDTFADLQSTFYVTEFRSSSTKIFSYHLPWYSQKLMRHVGFKSDHKTYMKLNPHCGLRSASITECCPAQLLSSLD